MGRLIDEDMLMERLGFLNTPQEREENAGQIITLEDFDSIMSELTEEGHIIMSRARLKKHEENYALINQFSDGKNAQRIYDELIKNGLI